MLQPISASGSRVGRGRASRRLRKILRSPNICLVAQTGSLAEGAPGRTPRAASTGRIATGLHKIGIALRHAAWNEHPRSGLTPTQAQLLVLVDARPGGRTLSALAAELGVTAPTASDSVSALERKGLVEKRRAAGDARALAVRPSPAGRRLARRLALWPDFLLAAIDELDVGEREVFQRALVKMIRSLQIRGRIPVARMCVGCRFFRPYAHASSSAPHHCAFVDAPFGDAELRLDCADQQPAPPEEAEAAWERFLAGAASSRSRKET
jgi:DNA-binding MarR family transcriptional regulator